MYFRTVKLLQHLLLPKGISRASVLYRSASFRMTCRVDLLSYRISQRLQPNRVLYKSICGPNALKVLYASVLNIFFEIVIFGILHKAASLRLKNCCARGMVGRMEDKLLPFPSSSVTHHPRHAIFLPSKKDCGESRSLYVGG